MAQIERMVDRLIESDVLVVGGGGAAANAAIAAGRAGARVSLAVKGALGRSGDTIMASAVLSMDGRSAHEYGEKKADRSITKDLLFEKIVRHGFFLSEQDLVRNYVDQGPRRVRELLELGRRSGQSFRFIPPNFWFTSGKAIGIACRKGVRETGGVTLFEDVMICDLLTNNGRIVGALGIDIYRGELIAFRARSVILCTGGYQPFSFTCANSDITGDGIAMAYRAGARLADMEFLLFLPGVLLSPRVHRGSIFPFLLYVGGLLVPEILNSSGDRITDHMEPELRELAQGHDWFKLINAYYWGKEISSGKGTSNGGLYFDFSNHSKIKYLIGALKSFFLFKGCYHKGWFYQGDDMSSLYKMARKGLSWEVGLTSEYSMGGIVVDSEMGTDLPGLYAAGEAASGVFGANRTVRALTDILVQGYLAGESAARYARNTDLGRIDADQLATIKALIMNRLNGSGGVCPGKVLSGIRAAADRGLGAIRDERGLREALGEIERIREEDIPVMRAGSATRVYNYEWLQAFQTENLSTCAEAGVRAALMRKESRGNHIRSDYPEVDHDHWIQRIFISNDRGRMALSKHLPKSTRLPPPAGYVDTVLRYAVICENKLK
ncbi:FAD-binding protein [Thermodesulfobacteriota bacterium]